MIGSLSRADYYETDILASVTLAQGIYEGGWGRYSLPVGGNNLFGIKAYSTWSGMVYDQNEHLLYSSYEDFTIAKGQSYINKVSAWRAHESWAESVKVHSSLFLNESKYAAVVGETDYAVMAQAIVDAGYCNDNGYADTVIELIEQYGLTEYDDLTPDSDGIVAITTEQERARLDIGETYTVPLTYYPAGKTPSSVVWASDNTSVATVDQNGKVTALAHGTTLITATLENGREACCIVYVDCNATIIDKDVYVYASPTSATTYDKIYRGEGVKVTSDAVYTNSSGEKLMAVKGYNRKGELVNGYVLAQNVYLNERNVSDIAVIKDSFTLKAGDSYTVKTVVAPADAADTALTWTSSNTSVATVDQNGVITAKTNGTATVKAAAAGGASVTLNITVASDYREYTAVVSAYEYVNVRAETDASSTRVGKIPFLSEVTVIGEPVGKWYKVTGATSSGTVITGYADSAYVRLVAEGSELQYAVAPSGIAIYSEPSTSSTSYGSLVSGSDYAILETLTDNWYYVVGLKSSSSGVYGYAKIGDVSTEPGVGSGAGTEAWYGRTTSDLYVRLGAGTGFGIVGRFAEGTDIVITGENNGWYKVSGVSNEGVQISGYSSADYIDILYTGVTTSNLRVRASDSTESEIVTTLSSGDEVVIVGEILESGWYLVEVNGYTGYCSGTYISVTGKLPAEGVDVPDVEFSITDPDYVISDSVLTGLSVKTTAAEFLSGFNGNVTVVDASGNALSSTAYVGTGCVLRVTANGTVTNVATVLIKGDVNGDGLLDLFDALAVKRNFLGTYDMNGVYLKAACVSGSTEVSIIDYVMIKRAILGTYTL